MVIAFPLILNTGKEDKVLRDGFFSHAFSRWYALRVRRRHEGATKNGLYKVVELVAVLVDEGLRKLHDCRVDFRRMEKKMLLWADSPPVHHLDMLDFASGSGEPHRLGE